MRITRADCVRIFACNMQALCARPSETEKAAGTKDGSHSVRCGRSSFHRFDNLADAVRLRS